MIKGLYETHLFVENLERSIQFYEKKLELTKAFVNLKRKSAFFWIGKPKQFMLGLWQKNKEEIDTRHFAFQCEPEWVLNESVNYLTKRNISVRNFLNDGTKEPLVFAWMPAISIYFEDPDGHNLEFIGILKGKSKPENGILTYKKWLALENQ